jgi:hypothetical protein
MVPEILFANWREMLHLSGLGNRARPTAPEAGIGRRVTGKWAVLGLETPARV